LRLLYLTDRLTTRGGADQHLSQVIDSAVAVGHEVTVAYGRADTHVEFDPGVDLVRVRGLGTPVDSGARLGRLGDLVDDHDVIHVQNVMNPRALRLAVRTGRCVATVQDHRIFCPGPGKTLPDGSLCVRPMEIEVCAACLPDPDYRARTIELTRLRLEALRGSVVIVLSRYMADELAAVGLDDVVVLPPWVEVGPPRSDPGSVVLVGGRLVAHKGATDGWRAWELAGRPLPLVVAGEGPLAPELHGAEDRGWLDATSLRRELRRARTLLFPSGWQEPFGILGVEALAEGTPVILAESGGTGDWSASGCLRVPAADVAAMASAIEDLAGDPELALELGQAGQEAVRQRFSRAVLEPRLHELYRNVHRGKVGGSELGSGG
jgi:glycosyltransferase involved in cell wall biosynthesis